MLPNILFLILGCSPIIEECTVTDLLPGMWSGHAEVYEKNYIDLDTDLHVQLFQDGVDIVGWLYHTDGVYTLQEQYSILHCEEISIIGELASAESGTITVDCLHEPDGATCLDFTGNFYGGVISIKNRWNTIDIMLDRYEEIGDQALENFHCLR